MRLTLKRVVLSGCGTLTKPSHQSSIIKQALQDRLPNNRRTTFGGESFYLDN